MSVQGLMSRIYKELPKCNNNKIKNPTQKCAKDLNRHFSKAGI